MSVKFLVLGTYGLLKTSEVDSISPKLKLIWIEGDAIPAT
jgi:hypothetical protein